MDTTQYNEGLALSLLPEDYLYSFEKIEVVKDIDVYGEVEMMIVGRANVTKVEDVKSFLEEFYAS